jgi:YHS domain-containing protein
MKKLLLTVAISTAFFTACATHDHSSHAAADAKPYPLKTCMVTDEDLDSDAYSFVYKGQEIKLCCKPCKEDFDKDPAKYLKKLAAK